MSKSNLTNHQATQALGRRARSLDLKPLDFGCRFIDDLIGTMACNALRARDTFPVIEDAFPVIISLST